MKPPTRKILIIDDSPEDRAEMRRLLLAGSETRYRFTEAELGAEGLRLCRDAGDGLPDVVLLDFSLPDMNAADLLAELCQGTDLPPFPVVVITGKDKRSGPELLRAGAQDFLGKNWTTAEILTRAVENAIDRFALLTGRKRAEEQIARQVRELEALYATAPTGLFQFGADLRFLRVNGRMAAINGRPVEAHIGRTLGEVLDPEAARLVERWLLQVLQTGEPVLGIEVQGTKAASVEGRDWLVNYYPLPNAAGEVVGVQGVVVDITERKQAEAALRESHLFTRRVLDGNLAAFVGVTTPDGTVTYANRPPLEAAGIPASEVVGKKFWDAYWWSYSPEVQAQLREACGRAAGGEIVRYDVPVRMAGDTRRWIDFQVAPLRDAGGRITHLIPSAMDITGRRETEAALHISETRYRRLFEAAKDGILILAGPTGRITDANPYILKALGLTRAEALGRELWEIGVFADATASRAAVAELQARDYVRYDDLPIESKTGERREVEVVANAYQEDGRRVIQCNIRDITERKQAEEKVRVAKEAAETANAAKDRFLAVLSHELRTPLAPVLMTLEMMELDPKLSAGVREDVAMMKLNIEMEVKLIDDLLDFNRIITGKLPLTLAPVDLNATIRSACELCGPAVRERGLRLETDLDPATGPVAADATRLRQVLWNVLSNAVKFTPKNGVIRVRAKRRDDARCEVRVQDSGMGIAPEMLTLIFDAFEQGGTAVTRQYGGLGLGLAICKALVERHRGSIRAESDGVGKGSTFIIELPGAERPVKATDVAGPAAGAQGSRQLRLLVVEDHADTARTLARLLKGAGFAVILAEDAAGALAEMERESFDVLLSDIGLPDGSGTDVMRGLRARGTVPGIAMSGFGMEEDVRRSREAGFSEHLVKPVAFEKLMEAIRRVTENRGG